MESAKVSVSVFEYDSFCQFLNDAIEAKKAHRKGFSLTVLCKKAAIGAPSTIVMLLKGQRRPSLSVAVRACVALDLTDNEIIYAEALVNLENAKSELERRVFSERLQRLRVMHSA